MKKNPCLVKEKLPFGKGDIWIEVTASYFAFLDFRADPNGTECLRVPTGTIYDKKRAITALRSVADFLESKLGAAEFSPCDPLPSPCAAHGTARLHSARNKA
jgi:hypothetical protein